MNDKVLSVNDISCINVDHYEAVGILKVGHFYKQIFSISENAANMKIIFQKSEFVL